MTNLVNIIESLEIERDNNKTLGTVVNHRLASLKGQTQALLAQGRAFVSQLEQQEADIEKAITVTEQEIADRDQALANLIGAE